MRAADGARGHLASKFTTPRRGHWLSVELSVILDAHTVSRSLAWPPSRHGPPKSPHLPGLKYAGLDERHLVWIQADAPAERLWVTEQLIKTNAAGLLVSWLPQARQEQIRRLQVCAQACDGPVFLCRPMAAEHEPSAAPLRVQLRFGLDWELYVHLLKRKGPTHEGDITLSSVPGGLESIITP